MNAIKEKVKTMKKIKHKLVRNMKRERGANEEANILLSRANRDGKGQVVLHPPSPLVFPTWLLSPPPSVFSCSTPYSPILYSRTPCSPTSLVLLSTPTFFFTVQYWITSLCPWLGQAKTITFKYLSKAPSRRIYSGYIYPYILISILFGLLFFTSY